MQINAKRIITASVLILLAGISYAQPATNTSVPASSVGSNVAQPTASPNTGSTMNPSTGMVNPNQPADNMSGVPNNSNNMNVPNQNTNMNSPNSMAPNNVTAPNGAVDNRSRY